MSFSAAALLTGTLIVIAPTSEGLVVAADSLAVDVVSKKQVCDRHYKILEVEGVDRTVIALAGLNGQTKGFKCGRTFLSLDGFYIPAHFKRYVETERKTADSISIAGFLPKLRDAFDRLPVNERQAMKSRYPNQGFARLIVASFDEKKSISIVRSAWVGFRAGSLVIAREDVERFSPNTKLNVMMFGEDGYAGRGLSNGTLTKRFVAPDSARILTVHVPVKTIEKRKAALAAFDLIDAVGEQMKTVPSKNKYGIPVTVGGPVDVVFLGKETRPERLIWKQEIPAWLTYPPPPPPPSFGRKPEPTHADVKSPLSAKTTLANAELGVSPLSKLLPPSSLSDMAIRFQVVPLKFFGDLLKTASVRRAPTAVTKDVSQDSPVAAARASDGVDVPTPGPEPQSPSTPLAPAANAGDAPLNNDATER